MAAHRSGLRYTCMSTKLAPGEVAYILQDSHSKVLVASHSLAALAEAAAKELTGVALLMTDGASGPFEDIAARLKGLPTTRIEDESLGEAMLYSSGTTGKPKGVRVPLPEDPAIGAGNGLLDLARGAFGFHSDTIYLSPAPLYHAAPLRWSLTVHRLGGTVVCMEKFDPELALQLIERHRVSESQWVPTHFVRLLKLDEAVRHKYDLSSLKCAVHAAAPCPVPIKHAMIDWWGPILREYYAGTEGNGFTFISSEEWLQRPGSVGRALLGIVRVCDDHGDEVPRGTEGQVFFEGASTFSYHNDPEKTRDATNRHGWTSLGDVGWQDDDGYLFLTDRKSFMIISGGVQNQSAENRKLPGTAPQGDGGRGNWA
eukprot:gene30540-39352_t